MFAYKFYRVIDDGFMGETRPHGAEQQIEVDNLDMAIKYIKNYLKEIFNDNVLFFNIDANKIYTYGVIDFKHNDIEYICKIKKQNINENDYKNIENPDFMQPFELPKVQ